MFGLVPKPLWSKRMAADELNRIPQHAHALMVELDDGRKGLVDTGCGPGTLFSDKERAMHGLGGDWPLGDALTHAGWSTDQIDFIVLTHLHWDHAGSLVAPAGATAPFPRATLIVHEQEWADALSGDPLLFKSYPAPITDALRSWPASRVKRVRDAEPGVLPGLSLIRSSGHTRGHSVIEFGPFDLAVGHSTRRVPWGLFAGDVCPTQHHLRMVFQTAYDTFPLDTRAWKVQALPRLAEQGGLLLFDHDPAVFGAFIAADPREEFRVVESIPCA